ncbi:nucleoside-diphosphate-sugar epimerase [Janthinobacterium sp. CG_23.3]|uniref:UDP-glucose 4-epimerase family protein n=1 Tax=Janthinobacterium sp. CG_23.3 TaxID=3349634 RepID=UPI0038D46994
MKILVTGADGFVGKALCDALHTRGLAAVRAVRTGGNGKVGVGNLSTTTNWQAALAGCDAVIHLAARVHVMNEQTHAPLAEFRAINVDATMNLARQAVAAGIRRFVFVSSVKVNGEETFGAPFTAFDVAAPQDAYGQSKWEAELGLRALAQETGLEVVIVRPPLVYGPGVRANFLNLMRLVQTGLPLPLGAIHNRRSMVALENLVDLLILCCQHRQAAGQVFMVSDGHDVSMTELLRLLSGAMKRRLCLLPLPASIISGSARLLGKSAVASRLLGSLQVDITHTRNTLSWRPVATMQEALGKTAVHFLSHR